MTIARLRSARLVGCLLSLALVGGAATPASADAKPRQARCGNADLVPAQDNLTAVRQGTLCLLNNERIKRNRVRLKRNPRLERAATRYTQDMIAREFFAHVTPGGQELLDRIRVSGYLDKVSSYVVGENLAWGTGTRATPRQTVRSWMASPSHRRNILDRRFREIGVGVALGAPESVPDEAASATYTTHFGRRT
jgi:uncharacterized protein YkwD